MAKADKTAKESLNRWLRQQLYMTRKQGRCVRFELNHMPPSGKVGAEIAVVNVGENLPADAQIDDSVIEQYAADLYEEATEYGEGIGDRQTFIVTAFFEEDPERGLARKAFSAGPNPDDLMALDSGAVAASEGASMAGIVKQLMRHNEAMMRVMVSSFGTTLTAQGRQIDRLSSMNEKFMESTGEHMDAIEELTSKRHERDLAIRKEEHKEAQIAKLADTAVALLPAVIAKATGAKVDPNGSNDLPSIQLLKLAEGLSAEELEGMLGAIQDPGMKIAFVQMLQTLKARSDAGAPNNGTQQRQ